MATTFQLQVSTDNTFATTDYDQSGLTSDTQSVTGLLFDTLYYWRVRTTDDEGTSDWSSTFSFTSASPTRSFDLHAAFTLRATDPLFFGFEGTNGTYKTVRSGNDLCVSRRESEVFVDKLCIGPTGITVDAISATTGTIGTLTVTSISGGTATLTDIYATGNVIVPKTSGKGIKVDTASPTFGWRDLLGDIKTRPAAGGGAAALPDYVAYRGSIYGYRFGTNAPNNHEHEAFVEYHIPHDYVPGSDLFLHLHWSQIVVDTGGAAGVPGVSEWFWDVTYAKGYGTAGGAADPFIAPITTTCTQQGSTTQYGHMICEVQLSATTPSASQLDSDNIEVDGLLLVRVYRDPGSANDTLDQDTFVHFCDVHYQSTNMATKDKNTPFYT